MVDEHAPGRGGVERAFPGEYGDREHRRVPAVLAEGGLGALKGGGRRRLLGSGFGGGLLRELGARMARQAPAASGGATKGRAELRR